jgi:hypothetical protein
MINEMEMIWEEAVILQSTKQNLLEGANRNHETPQ